MTLLESRLPRPHILTLHLRASEDGWRAECTCSWTGNLHAHPVLAEREAGQHQWAVAA